MQASVQKRNVFVFQANRNWICPIGSKPTVNGFVLQCIELASPEKYFSQQFEFFI